MYKPSVRTRHSTHFPLREDLSRVPFRSIVRLGSTTTNNQYNEERQSRGLRPITRLVECNTVEAVKTSSNKRLMKEAFKQNEVKTANWYVHSEGMNFINKQDDTNVHIGDLPYPVVVKNHFGSRGSGNTLIQSREELEQFMRNNSIGNYIVEKYYSYSKEYRLHVTQERCFYTCRKMLKRDTPEDQRWHRHDDNSVWILEENPDFDRPSNWDNVVAESIKALKSVGLDIGAIDVKIQSNVNSRGARRESPDFIILETNSAPSFGDVTLTKYLTEIITVLNKKNESR